MSVLPVLSLRVREGKQDAITLHDIEVCLDGTPIKGLQELVLNLTGDDINRAVLYLMVGKVETEGDVLTLLAANVKARS